MILLIASAAEFGVQRGECEVTCLGDRQSCGDRLQVAHFTDQG